MSDIMSEDPASTLSTTQRYRGIVHMIPYGWLDEAAGKVWVLLYRCGTAFEITINMSDIEGTAFAAKLAPYMVEPRNLEEQIELLHKSNDKNGLIIDHLFATLDDLAPTNGRVWDTLEDVLRTPTYQLSLQKGKESDSDAVTRIDLGPVDEPALDILQAPFDALTLDITPAVFTSTKTFLASDIRFPSPINVAMIPECVVLSTGEVATFIAAEDLVENGDSNRISNPSHFAVRTHLRLNFLRSTLDTSTFPPIGFQQVLGIVTTGTPPPNKDEQAKFATNNPSISVKHLSPGLITKEVDYLVGILLKPLPAEIKPLSDPSIISSVASDPTLAQKWHVSLRSTLTFLHSQSPPLYHGNISPETLLVCPFTASDTKTELENLEYGIKNDICLVGFSDNRNDESFVREENSFTPQGDLDALENIFGGSGWLETEVKRSTGEIADDYEWKSKE